MISFQNKPIIFETQEYPLLINHKYSAIIILTDHNVAHYCLEEFIKVGDIVDYNLISIAPGEGSKTLETAGFIFDQLIEHKVDRHALLINLGGGMISDLGGFCASIYKRG